MVWTLMPPAQYIHPPHVAVLEMVLGREDFRRLCHNAFPSQALACSFDGHVRGQKGLVCFVVLPAGTRLNLQKLRTHEQAHCNGWPGNHPGGHYEYIGEY